MEKSHELLGSFARTIAGQARPVRVIRITPISPSNVPREIFIGTIFVTNFPEILTWESEISSASQHVTYQVNFAGLRASVLIAKDSIGPRF